MATSSKPSIRIKTKDGGIFTMDVEVAKVRSLLHFMMLFSSPLSQVPFNMVMVIFF